MAKKSSKIVQICEKVSKYSIYILVLLLPLFFLPWTANVLEFNKQALLIFLVLISLFAWLLKILISGKFSFNLNWIHIPVGVLFLVYLASTIFSSWRYGSFWGWPQVISGSLISLIVLILFYFLVVSIFEKREIFRLVTLLILSGSLAIFYGIFQLFGKYLIPLNFTKIASFNTIGAVNSLGVFTAVLLPLVVVLIMNSQRFLRAFFIIALILNVLLLILINFPVAWWLVIAGSVLVIVFGVQKKEFIDNRWLTLPMFILALALFFSFFRFQIPGTSPRAIEVSLTNRATFSITREILKESPVLGSGPGTFVYNFSKYKDVSFNQSSFWNIRFEQGSSKILTLLTTTGILGVFSFLVLIGSFIWFGIKFLFKGPEKTQLRNSSGKAVKENLPRTEGEIKNERFSETLILGVFISFVTLSIGYFLHQSVLSLDFIYFLLIAVFVVLLSPAKKMFVLKPSSLITLGVTFAFTLIFIFGLGILILEGQRYAASVSYLQGLKAWQQGETDDSIKFLSRAASINSGVDLYWRELSQIYLQNINEVTGRTDLSREEITNRIQLSINNAVNSAKMATDANSKNVANWSVRGFVYQNLIGVVAGTGDWAVKSYEEALNIEPTNPYFPTQAGISLLRKAVFLPQERAEEKEKIYEDAKSKFEKAIELKTDYAPARFQLAVVYQTQGKQSEAIQELERTRNIVPSDVGLAFQLGLIYYQNKDYQKAQAELERAVFLNPNYSNALYFLGLTYNQFGERQKAIEQFKRVSALNPDNAGVKKILENLKAGKESLEGVVEDVPPIVPIEEESPEEIPIEPEETPSEETTPEE